MAEPALLGGYSAKSSALLRSANGMKCPGQERKGRLAGEIQSEKTKAVKWTKQKENKNASFFCGVFFLY